MKRSTLQDKQLDFRCGFYNQRRELIKPNR
mgnify:CR=1 FL=1|jgi:hypothetical protein